MTDRLIISIKEKDLEFWQTIEKKVLSLQTVLAS